MTFIGNHLMVKIFARMRLSGFEEDDMGSGLEETVHGFRHWARHDLLQDRA